MKVKHETVKDGDCLNLWERNFSHELILLFSVIFEIPAELETEGAWRSGVVGTSRGNCWSVARHPSLAMYDYIDVAIVQQLCALCATSPRLLQLLVIFIDRHKSRYFYIIMLWNKQRHWKVDFFYISWMYNSNIMQNIITVECAWDV